MAFGFAGAAQGASRALEEIVAQRLLEQKLEAEIADRQSRQEMERQQLSQRQKEFDVERGQRQQTIDMQAGDRRARSNQQGVRRMLGEAITQGDGPMSSQDRRGLAALQVEAGDEPTMLKEPDAPKPIQYTYTDPKTGHKSLRLMAPGEVPPTGLDMGREPPTPQRPDKTVVHNVGGKLVDSTGRVIYDGGNAQGVDPAKAKEKGTSMLDAARSLRNHPGLGNLTGARIGNPDYALGVAQEPIAGSKAADAQSFFNQLKSQFTLDNIGLLKGVLSDSDMKILQQASTSLDTKMQDATFAAELDKVIQKLESALGGGQASLAPMQPVNSHGTAPPNRVDELIKKYGGGGV